MKTGANVCGSKFDYRYYEVDGIFCERHVQEEKKRRSLSARERCKLMLMSDLEACAPGPVVLLCHVTTRELIARIHPSLDG